MKTVIKCLGLILVIIYSSLPIMAEENIKGNSLEIEDISYDYDIIHDDADCIDCYGELKITITVPAGARSIVVRRSLNRMTNGDKKLLIVTPFLIDDETVLNISLSDIRWGVLFKVEAIFDDDALRRTTSVYDINDFIDKEDLIKIKNQVGVESIHDESVHISTSNNNLIIDTDETSNVNVYNFRGEILYTASVLGYLEIPITDQFIIVRCQISDNTFTKKS